MADPREEILTKIKTDISEVKNKGQEYISISAFEKYIDDFLNNIGGKISGTTEERLANYNAGVSFSIEMLRSVFQYGQAALKSAILINGGASVAMLSFISSQIAKSAPAGLINNISISLVLFVFGTLAAAIASGTAYLTQWFYHHKPTSGWGRIFNILSVILIIGSYFLFGYGAYSAFEVFKSSFAC